MKVVKFAILVPIVFVLACSSKEPKLADVKWDSKNSAVEDAEKNIKLTMISDEEKEKHYKKVNVFRVVDIPKTYDMEIIRGDKMQKDGGYRTGIYVEGKEKIVSKVPDFNGNYEFSAIFSRDYFK